MSDPYEAQIEAEAINEAADKLMRMERGHDGMYANWVHKDHALAMGHYTAACQMAIARRIITGGRYE